MKNNLLKYSLVISLVIGLILRILLMFTAYHGDLNNNISWAHEAVVRGLRDFYEGENWPYSAPNQPPLTILTFYVLEQIYTSVSTAANYLNSTFPLFPSKFIWFWEEKGMVLLIKLPFILADLGIGYMIYRYFKIKGQAKKGLWLNYLWLINPVSWYVSSIWGQTDSMVNLLGLIAIYYLLHKRLLRFMVFLTLSLLFKGSLSIFVPLLISVAFFQRHRAIDWLKAIGFSLIILTLVSISFHPAIDLPVWLINLYQSRIIPGEIGFLTANAFNFWWLVNPGRVPDTIILFLLPARSWGFIISLVGIGLLIYWLSKKITDSKMIFSLMVTALLTFLFMTRIHERYLYPFFPMATILLGYSWGYFPIYLIFSLTFIINLYHLFWAPSLPYLEGLYKLNWFIPAVCIFNLVLLLISLLGTKKYTSENS